MESRSYDNFAQSLTCIKKNILDNEMDISKKMLEIENRSTNKKQIKEQEEARKKLEIERKIKKWMKDYESKEIEFKSINSFYCKYIHDLAKTFNGVVSESREDELDRYVALAKTNFQVE